MHIAGVRFMKDLHRGFSAARIWASRRVLCQICVDPVSGNVGSLDRRLHQSLRHCHVAEMVE